MSETLPDPLPRGKGVRLCHPDIERAAEPVCLSFDGAEVEALPGETLAAALSAAGILAFRRTAKGSPRGLYCGMGACFDCLVTVDGKANQRACLVKAQAGMVVASAPPDAPLPLAPAPAAIEDRACDLLVVGAGPAGLAAAEAAAAAGAQVVVLDERGEAGGQYLKPLAASHAHAAPDRQFRQGDALRAAAQGGRGRDPDRRHRLGRLRRRTRSPPWSATPPSPSARAGWSWPPARMNARCRSPAGPCRG